MAAARRRCGLAPRGGELSFHWSVGQDGGAWSRLPRARQLQRGGGTLEAKGSGDWRGAGIRWSRDSGARLFAEAEGSTSAELGEVSDGAGEAGPGGPFLNVSCTPKSVGSTVPPP